jgi:hypothetical protein
MAELLKKRAEGHCFRCLAKDHQTVECRNPFKCLLCFNSGHRTRSYRAYSKSSAAPAPTLTSIKPPPSYTTMIPHCLVLHDRGRLGSPSHRADAKFMVECSTDMVAAENEFHSCGIIAISIYDDLWYHLTRDAV